MIQSSNFRVDTRNLPSISSKYVNARKGEKDEERSNTRRRNICILITAILVLAIMAAVGVVYIVFIRNINAASSKPQPLQPQPLQPQPLQPQPLQPQLLQRQLLLQAQALAQVLQVQLVLPVQQVNLPGSHKMTA
ncbi:unnamed protein product [Rotaria magnacalcarata]|uniref:Uncharacterized protein n=1 Tax=Rotaria magnacalcarata TaxID=392030 RepID=A0A820CPD7_9BILA|nr:unnamed protein product [Rotaria magnacalcarata]CAF4219156.1 unnamed protein product [Rotaria magnacalcarata]